MKECPRCHDMTMNDDEIMNSLSRRDNKTYICHECGDDEGFIDAGVMQPDDLEHDFVAAVAKQTE